MTESLGKGRPTIRDVANYAGVSHMTVSRVINDRHSVKPETRKLVQEAIRELRFSPNRNARALAGADDLKIALLHRFPNQSRLGEYLIELVTQTVKLHATMDARYVSSESDGELLVRTLVESGVKAVILAPPLADDTSLGNALRAAKLAIVALGSCRSEKVASVGIDDHDASKAATNHLIALGHRRIGYIKGEPSHASTQFRLAGFRSAMEQAGLQVDDTLVIEGKYTYRSGLEAAERLLTLNEPPTAVFASNDDMAAGTISVAHRYGIQVPSQLSICGFDDTALATTVWPELTTVRQPVAEITRLALDLLLAELDDDNAPSFTARPQIMLPYTLVLRQSDAPPFP